MQLPFLAIPDCLPVASIHHSALAVCLYHKRIVALQHAKLYLLPFTPNNVCICIKALQRSIQSCRSPEKARASLSSSICTSLLALNDLPSDLICRLLSVLFKSAYTDTENTLFAHSLIPYLTVWSHFLLL